MAQDVAERGGVTLATAATLALRSAVPIVVNVQPVRDSVHRMVAPCSGTLGVPAGKDWPEAAQRVRAGQPLLAIASHGAPPELLISPINGVLLSVLGHPGGRARESDELVHVAPTAVLELAVTMGPADAASTPADAQLVLQPADGPARVIPVQGRRPSLRLDTVVWRMENGDDLFSPGQQLPGALRIGEPRVQLAIPARAVFLEGGTQTVFVQTQPQIWQLRRVVTRPADGVYVSVTSGLKAGEQVAAEGVETVRAAMSRARALLTP